VFLDDILIYSESKKKNHVEHLRVVFEILKTNKLFTREKKCNSVVIQVDYLGHVVLDKGMVIDPRKIKVVAEWPILKN